MFHKCKSGCIEYWNHNDGFLHLYRLLLQWTFTVFRLYEAHLVGLRSQFCGPYVWLYSECGQPITPNFKFKHSKKCVEWGMSV